MTREKLAVCIMQSGIRKRIIAEALWEEAEKDFAKAREMLEKEREHELQEVAH